MATREDFLYSFKVGRVLDLYQGVWTGQPLGPNDYVDLAREAVDPGPTYPYGGPTGRIEATCAAWA